MSVQVHPGPGSGNVANVRGPYPLLRRNPAMTPTIATVAQALLFTGGLRLIHANRGQSQAVGAVLAIILILALGVAAFSVLPPNAVSDDAIRAADPAFELLGP
jgi:hypothetical protein